MIKEHPVLLNRAPTLHRLGIQAFEPVLVEGRAIQIHPLVCTAYNADFDGDQMAVHVPLSAEAQAEARLLMLSTNNILVPSSGRPIVTPTQDMVIGIYYLTSRRAGAMGEGKYFGSIDEVRHAYDAGAVSLHAWITLRQPDGSRLETTPGRLFFNEVLPEGFEYINDVVDKEETRQLSGGSLQPHRCLGNGQDSRRDHALGLSVQYPLRHYCIGGGYFGPCQQARAKVRQAEAEVDQIESQFRRGLLTPEERYQRVCEVWTRAKETITKRNAR